MGVWAQQMDGGPGLGLAWLLCCGCWCCPCWHPLGNPCDTNLSEHQGPTAVTNREPAVQEQDTPAQGRSAAVSWTVCQPEFWARLLFAGGTGELLENGQCWSKLCSGPNMPSEN